MTEKGNIVDTRIRELVKCGDTAILYSNIRSFYKLKKNGQSKLNHRFYRTSYKKLATEFKCSMQTIRRRLIELEQLGLIQRYFFHEGQKTNILNILVWKNHGHFENDVGIEKTDKTLFSCRELDLYKNVDINKNVDIEKQVGSLQKCRVDLYKNVEIIIGSTLNSNTLNKDNLDKEKEEEKEISKSDLNSEQNTFLKRLNQTKEKMATQDEQQKEKSLERCITGYFDAPKKLKDFYPLVELDKVQIHSLSGKDSDLDSLNSLLLKLSDKYPNYEFKSQKAFYKYITTILQKSNSEYFDTPKKLKDFLLLNKQDQAILRSSSGRQFTLNFMNSLLLKLSNDYPNYEFKSQKSFYKYMTTSLKNEKHDAVKTDNEDFKHAANIKPEEREIMAIEKELTDIEENTSTSPEIHFKKKLCAVLDRVKARELIRSYKSIKIEGEKFELHLNKQVELSDAERRNILDAAKATHETANFTTREINTIETLDIIVRQNKNPNFNAKYVATEPNGIWGKVRKGSIEKLGDEGEAIDRNWFSHFNAEVDEEKKEIKLIAESDFYKTFTSNRYGSLLQNVAKEHDYICVFC